MQISSRFTLAIHTMLCIAHFSSTQKITSEFVAKSTGANPVSIRRIMGQLKKAGLVTVKAGIGGASISKDFAHITLYDIFLAVETAHEDFFTIHNTEECPCRLGMNIHTILDSHLKEIQRSMYAKMQQTTLQKLFEQAHPYL